MSNNHLFQRNNADFTSGRTILEKEFKIRQRLMHKLWLSSIKTGEWIIF
jgi:hypothetical protein